MLCEPTFLQNNHTKYNPWKPKNKRNISGASSSVNAKTSSLKQYSSGTKNVPELSFKTSSSPGAKSITPEKNNDVEMGEANEGAAVASAAVGHNDAKGGGESADNSDADSAASDENSNGDGDAAMGEAGKSEGGDEDAKKTNGEGDDSDSASKPNPNDESNKDSGENKLGKSVDDETAENGNGNKAKSDKTASKKDKEGGENEKEPVVDESLPLLVGTLAYSDRDNLRRHIIRGNWKYENSHASPPQRFELIRTIPHDEELKELPKDGEFSGSFNVQLAVKTSKGKIKMKNRAVPESGVKLTFKEKDEEEGTYAVKGTGTNEYGVFELIGSATKNTGVEGDPTYSVSVRKKYVIAPAPPAKKAGESKSKDKKRKHAGDAKAAVNDGPKPPPTELPDKGICLRGKLARNTSDELSLDNAAVHRIAGLWAMEGPSKILEDPDNCEKFEYEHKCSGDSTVFPLSGRYTGFFYVSEAVGERTKIAERDVTLRFHPNNAGYHNVEGRGGNIYGKYNITGTLTKDGTITIFRHFQAPKVKASKKSTQVKISASGGVNGSSSKPEPKLVAEAAVAGARASSLLSFDDVNSPEDEVPPPLNPPEQFTATSRGILKIEDDGTHTCSGSWAMTNAHFQSGLTSKYHFGIEAHNAADDAKAMLDRMKSNGLDDDDDRQIKVTSRGSGGSPITLANSTFPIDSTQYKGSFKLRKGATRTQTIVDQQIVLKYVKNTGGSYNVYGKGSNEMGTFDLAGTLILQGKSNGLMQLYRMYPKVPVAKQQPVGSRKSSKAFPGSLTEKATLANSGPVPAMKPPEPFIPSMSGLQRRESSRMSRLPSRLEEDDPEAHMDRLMERCRQILKEMQDGDVQKIFAVPVDPIALGIPQYFDYIETPMDLGTIQTKIDNNAIDSPEEFARLVRLTFENAIKFNSLPDNIVHITARNLLVLFNKKFGTIDKAYNAAKKNKKLTKVERQELKRKEKETAKEAKRKEKQEKERKRKAEVEASNESKRMKLENVLAANKSTMAAIAQAAPKDPNASVTRSEYDLLIQAIKEVQDQIVGLHKLVKKSPAALSSSIDESKVAFDMSSAYEPSYAAESTSQSSKPKKKKQKKEVEPSSSPAPSSPKRYPMQAPVVEDLQPLSFEEQESLSEAINLLPEHLLPGAMQIIRESDFVNDDDDEIDLDIDQLDTRTQRKLQSFVFEVRLTIQFMTHHGVFLSMRYVF